MSFVNAAPDRLMAAARNLAGIGSTLNASNAAAAAPTLAVSAAASDQVSAAVAAFFSGHAQGYQKLSAEVARFHGDFVQALNADADTYASAESANASQLRQLTNAAPDAPALGTGETVKAVSGPPAAPSGVAYEPGGVRTASPRTRTAAGPVGGAAPKGPGTGSSTESVTPSGNCGSGGILLRTAPLSEPAVGWSGSTAKAGASGGLLSRLVDAEGVNDRSSTGARNGVWLDGIRGAGLTNGANGANGANAANGANGRGVVQRGFGAGGSGGLAAGAGSIGS